MKAPPADAKKTASGLAYKVLQPGTGTRHPTATSQVTVHYSGWTTDGKMFDSSVTRGEPATFPLNGVIKGWTEGLQLMVEGEKARFWIPEDLAYQGQQAAVRHARVRRRAAPDQVGRPRAYARAAWISIVTRTSSPTRSPPVSSAAFHVRPKSFRSSVIAASNAAFSTPHGSRTDPR